MVSVSRVARPPQDGQAVTRKDSERSRGEGPSGEKSTSSGRRTGRSASGTGTVPHVSQ